MPSVLIVDDLTAIHEMLAAVIQPTGYTMAFAENGDEALKKYKGGPFDVVLADISMQPMDGITLLQQLKAFDPECVTIMMTGYASTDTAIRALKHGAFDYIQKPFKIDELLQTLRRAVEFGSRNRAMRHSGGAEPVKASADLSNCIVGQSAKVQRLRQQVVKVTAAQTPLLIEGETGTGKKTIAEAIHEAANSGGPFIMVDCGNGTETAFHSGLIGVAGLGGDWVERAKGGTLFLQNVHRLPAEVQEMFVAVMKRMLNDTRLICGSSLNLESLVDEGLFQDELFYRIATLPLVIPPLREHLEDLPALVKHFLKQATNPRFEGAQMEFEADTIEALKAYYWPGNLVELGQVVKGVASSSEKRIITRDQLPPKVRGAEGWPTLEQFLHVQKENYVRQVLKACKGDRDRAAQLLGCPVEKVDEYAEEPRR